ncbi:hypothetical protein CK203_021036 [Vitis vinifera]|uniref:2-oxo-4-hydroxy-4-carboxy-5-ureidoimidazoline decarboxylase n=1 Tax=Vitis vinifera TaxID=29760 RepID=A0A438JX36_VITVI|nr:hypothetical protein CK203_021036 [Vitis vinifera]
MKKFFVGGARESNQLRCKRPLILAYSPPVLSCYVGKTKLEKKQTQTEIYLWLFDFENVKTVIHLVLQELSDWNARYWKKFGFVFLICASGRTASEILAELKVKSEIHLVFQAEFVLV